MAGRRWEVELDGRRRVIALEHGTWMRPVRLLVDSSVIARRNAMLAIGYNRALDLTGVVDGHLVTAAMRVAGTLRDPYRYSLLVDGVAVPGSDPGMPAPTGTMRSPALGILETIVWASMLSAAVRTLANGEVVRAVLLIPAAILASLVLRRPGLPTSWRVVGTVLVVAAWVLAVTIFVPLAREPMR